MTSDALLQLLRDTAGAVAEAIAAQDDWSLLTDGAHPGQYGCDVAADAAALRVLDAAGVGVLSEESGLHRRHEDVLVVVDPIDGSTNASRGLPWYCTSLCAVDGDGLAAALVVNQRTGTTFEAVRGGGATCDGRPIRPSPETRLDGAIVGAQGWPRRHLGWKQFRVLGAAALDLCAVAGGQLDAYVDCIADSLSPWDYLAAVLVIREAGGVVGDLDGRELELREPGRRTLVAAGTQQLFDELVAARRAMDAEKSA